MIDPLDVDRIVRLHSITEIRRDLWLYERMLKNNPDEDIFIRCGWEVTRRTLQYAHDVAEYLITNDLDKNDFRVTPVASLLEELGGKVNYLLSKEENRGKPKVKSYKYK